MPPGKFVPRRFYESLAYVSHRRSAMRNTPSSPTPFTAQPLPLAAPLTTTQSLTSTHSPIPFPPPLPQSRKHPKNQISGLVTSPLRPHIIPLRLNPLQLRLTPPDPLSLFSTKCSSASSVPTNATPPFPAPATIARAQQPFKQQQQQLLLPAVSAPFKLPMQSHGIR